LVIGFTLPALLSIMIWIIYKAIYHMLSKNEFKLYMELLSTSCFIYIVGIISVTIFPISIGIPDLYPMESNFIPFASISELLHHSYFMVPLRNIGGNILLFIPFGILMPLKFERLNKGVKIITLSFLSSLTIECIQLGLPLRAFDIDDIILNSCGTCIGFLIYKGVTSVFMDRQPNKKIDKEF